MKYKNEAYENKLLDLIISAGIDIEDIFNRENSCELNKLLNVMKKKGIDGNSQNNGFSVFIAATTASVGDSAIDELPENAEPLQISAIAYKLNDDGSVEIIQKKAIVNYNIKVSDEAMANLSDNEDHETDTYDVLKDSGIDITKYKDNIKGYVHTVNETIKKLDDFFLEFPPEQYPIISMGKKAEKTVTYAQEVFGELSDSDVFDSPMNVDFIRALQEYCCRVYYDDNYKNNVVLNEDELISFSLKDIVSSDPDMVSALTNDQSTQDEMLVSTKKKAFAIAMLADEIRMQDMEMFEPQKYKALVGETDTDDTDDTSERNEIGSERSRKHVDETDLDLILNLKDINNEISAQERKRDVVIVEGNTRKTAEADSENAPDTSYRSEEDIHKEMLEERRRRSEDNWERAESNWNRSERRWHSFEENRPVYDAARGRKHPQKQAEDVTKLISVIEEQQKLLAQKDAMIESVNESILLLTERLTTTIERQTALLEELLMIERQWEDK